MRPAPFKKLTDAEIKAIADVQTKALEPHAPTYTPSSLKRFKDELERYSYLFTVKFEQHIPLVIEDIAWMEKFEQTAEFLRNYQNRFATLRSFYEVNQQTA